MLLLNTQGETIFTDSPLTNLVYVVINAILEVFFLCLVGWILAKNGIVDAAAKKTLNKINVSLFTPALLFSKVAFSLSPDKLADLIIIPIGFVIITSCSALIAMSLSYLLRLKKSQRNFAIACSMFQNSNSLPIALMQSLIGEKMPLKWGDDDTKDQMLGRALSYLVLFSTLGIIVRWSIGVRLLTSAEASNDSEIDPALTQPPHSSTSTLIQDGEYHHDHVNDEDDDEDEHETLLSKVHQTRVLLSTPPLEHSPPTNPLLPSSTSIPKPKLLKPKRSSSKPIFQSFPNTPRTSVHTSLYSNESTTPDEEGDDEDEEWGPRRGFGRSSDDDDLIFLGAWNVRVRRWRRRIGKWWEPIARIGRKIGQFMTVPLWAAILSLFVACVPPLQHALNEAEPLKAAIKNAGNCSVPLTLITLGAYFYRPTSPPTTTVTSPQPLLTRLNPFNRPASFSSTRSSTRGETRTVFVAVFSRMILVPLIMLPLFGWYAAKTTNVADDPVFVVVACLLIGSPTAITLAQITSNASGDLFEKLISRTLFVSYAFLTAPTTIALVLAALLIDRNQ